MTIPAPPPPVWNLTAGDQPPPENLLPPAGSSRPPAEDFPATGLFGAAESTAAGSYMFAPVPVATINGQDVPSTLAGAAQVVLDGVSITWGREGVLDQPDPSTGHLELFDTTGRWARLEDRRGQSVTLRARGILADNTVWESTYFRGRIGSPLTVSRKRVVHPVTGETIVGTLVSIPLEGALVDLANRVPTVAWPAETMGARATRVETEILATGTTQMGGFRTPAAVSAVVTRDYWKTPNVAPVAADAQVSLLDHLVALYDSSGADRMTYSPDTRRVSNLLRKEWTGSRGAAGLVAYPAGQLGQARAGKGVFMRSYAQAGGLNLYLDADALEYDPAEGVSQPTRITRAQVAHPDEGNAYKTRTVEKVVAGADERVSGVRTARLESLVAWNPWADLTLSDVESLVAREGSAWTLEPVRLSTRKLGGFESAFQAAFLLAGAETETAVFLAGSLLPGLGVRPLFGLQGGTIAYASGGWDLDLILSPVTTPAAQHAITFEEIDAGGAFEVQWWDEDHPQGMHESLTFEDLGYCATGWGVPTSGIGPNTGWDEYV